MTDKIYFFHETGAPSHVYALEYLLNQHNIRLEYREFNYYIQLGHAIKHLNFRDIRKLLKNIGFLITLLFTSKRKIVFGIAPYNYFLKWLRFFLKRHSVYYFTSYTCWDQTRMARKKFYSPKILTIWKNFLNNNVKHIFAVSQLTRDELIKNGFSTFENISVVNHSYKENIEPSENETKTNKFIYAGRLENKKGISELLCIFAKHPQTDFTLVGKGKLENIVEQAAKKYDNIHYIKYLKGLEKIIPIYKKNSFLVLNSQREGGWEELFGITIIEGMACGLIPITTNHPGPKEIITSYQNGIICDEGTIEKGIDYALNMKNEEFLKMKQKAISRGKEFKSSIISEKWNKILQ